MSSGDEAFEKFIEVDYSEEDYCEENVDCDEHDDSDKENSTNAVNLGARAEPIKQTQIEKIVAFMKENNEKVIEKSVYAGMWKTLTKKLNDLGPPKNSAEKWKRAWSSYKYRHKNQFIPLFDAASDGEPSTSNRPPDQLSVVNASHWNYQLSKVLEQQDCILNTLDKQTAIIERSCHLLEEISKKK